MQKVLISACLLGEMVRYDGGHCLQASEILADWEAEGRLVPLCPEVAGGLPVPRQPAEIQPDGRVVNVQGEDVSAAFAAGAAEALSLCRQHGIQLAVLKQGSPSCGSSLINDGSFAHRKVHGRGITAALLAAQGIAVYGEHELVEAMAALARLEASAG